MGIGPQNRCTVFEKKKKLIIEAEIETRFLYFSQSVYFSRNYLIKKLENRYKKEKNVNFLYI